jgi:hypothetical protein
MEPTPSRQTILTALTDGLRDHPAVHALWLEGADAHGRADQYSDPDPWLDVEDGETDAVLAVMRTLLTALAPLDYDHEFRHPHPQIRQVCFHCPLAGCAGGDRVFSHKTRNALAESISACVTSRSKKHFTAPHRTSGKASTVL